MDVSTEESNLETAETRSETRLIMNGTGREAEVVYAGESNRKDSSFCGSCLSRKLSFKRNFYLFGHSHNLHISIFALCLPSNGPEI